MARLVFPDEGSRLVYDPTSGRPQAATTVSLFTDSAGTVVATDLLNSGGTPFTSGQVTTDAYGLIPLFSGPVGVDTLYARVGTGGVSPVYARAGDRIVAYAVSTASRPVNANDPKYGLLGDGTDESAKVAAAFADAGPTGTVEFAVPGTYRFSQIVGGFTSTDVAGVTVKGNTQKTTFLEPPNATAPVFDFRSYGNSQGDGIRLRDFTLRTTVDRAYDKPLVRATLVKSMKFDSVGISAGTFTGTGVVFDGAYEWTWRDSDLLTGKFFVPLEVRTDTVLYSAGLGKPPQVDTMKLDRVKVTGCVGPILRNTADEGHGFTFDAYKIVGTNYYPSSTNVETTLASAAAAGDTTISVTSATGINIGATLVIDYETTGSSVEIAKVTAVSGTTLTLSQPLRWAHDPTARGFAIPVMLGGIGAAIGSGWHAIDARAVHFEGPQVGFGLGGVRAADLSGYLGLCGEFVRIYGGVQHLRVGTLHMFGTSYANKVLFRPTYNPSSSDTLWRVDGPISIDPSASIQSVSFGEAHTSRNMVLRRTDGAQMFEQTFGIAGTAKRRETQLSGAVVSQEFYSGQRYDHDGVKGKYVSGAGKTAITDADFTKTPVDGMTATVYDSTTDAERPFLRVGGVWREVHRVGRFAPLRSGDRAETSSRISTTTGTPTAGVLYVSRMTLRGGKAYSTATFGLNTAGTSITNAYVGVWDVTSLARLATSADISSSLMTTNGPRTAALSYTPSADGDFWVGLLIGGGTPGAMVCHQIGNSSVAALDPAVCHRHNTTGLTALPDPLVLQTSPSGFLHLWMRYE